MYVQCICTLSLKYTHVLYKFTDYHVRVHVCPTSPNLHKWLPYGTRSGYGIDIQKLQPPSRADDLLLPSDPLNLVPDAVLKAPPLDYLLNMFPCFQRLCLMTSTVHRWVDRYCALTRPTSSVSQNGAAFRRASASTAYICILRGPRVTTRNLALNP